MPAKLILVPFANDCGLCSQTFSLSGVHFSSFFAASAGENWYPGTAAMFSSVTPYRFGPILLAPPFSKVWHCVHTFESC